MIQNHGGGYLYPQQGQATMQHHTTMLADQEQQNQLPPAQQTSNFAMNSSAFSQYQQFYQQYYHDQTQQPAQPHYLPSIMLPPQSPTLASYYFEGSNGWVNHYYDPKRRQYLSSRVDPDFRKHRTADMSAATLPTLDSLGLNPQQLQVAIQQHQLLQQQHHQQQQAQTQQQQQQQLPQNSNVMTMRTAKLKHHMHSYSGHDLNGQVLPQAPTLHNAISMQQLQSDASSQYLAAAAAAAAVGQASAPSTNSTALLAQQHGLPQIPLPNSSAEWTEEWRENLLQYAHSLYSTAPRNPFLLSLLHLLHDAYPTHLPTILLLACVYYTHQDYQSSLRYNQLILKYDQNYVEAMSNIGTTLRSMGRTADAEQWWYQAVKLRPGYWDAVENLVGVLCSPVTNALGNHEQQDAENRQKGERQSNVYPRYKEALGVCEFVEQYFFKTQEELSGDVAIKVPKHLPVHQLPRLQNLFYAKGNLKYALGDIAGARREYEKGLELAFGGTSLIAVSNQIALACGSTAVMEATRYGKLLDPTSLPLVLLQPDQAVRILQLAFSQSGGVLPGMATLQTSAQVATAGGEPSNASSTIQQANQTTSTILLTLAKLFQDMMNPATPAIAAAATANNRPAPTMSLLLPLYYLSLALHPSPSTANNLGIILSNISGASAAMAVKLPSVNTQQQQQPITGTTLAMQYYMYGLQLDPRHPHLYTNLGSLLKDMGHLNEAVCMYEKAVEYNPRFDVALANLGNAIKDMGRVQDSVQWYRRAVEVNPNFVDAVCGLVNSLGGVCDWRGRGGVGTEPTVDQFGNLYPSTGDPKARSGWIGRVVEIVEKQLDDGAVWGVGILKIVLDQSGKTLGEHLAELMVHTNKNQENAHERLVELWTKRLRHFANAQCKKNEGGWLIRLIERIMRRLQRNWYLEQYGAITHSDSQLPMITLSKDNVTKYQRPHIPSSLATPPVPTVLPFHTFTYPLNARQVRLISHRNALRISHSTLTSTWVPAHVYPPPPPPSPRLKIGYVSSDFNNHPLAHLMQSVFGFHTKSHYEVFCYATTPSDNSPYRQKIEREAEHFLDVSSWSNQQVVDRIIADGIHVLVNLNGYTKGARNEIFAARPCPVQCSFMGFAGTLGGGWCDWIIADRIVCPPEMVSCEVWRQRGGYEASKGGDFEGDIDPEEDTNDFVYTEKFIYMPHSYFVNDHKQGFREEGETEKAIMMQPAALMNDPETLWSIEEDRRWSMRREVFPNLPDDVVIFANFNQLYKLEPSTFRMWLRILERVPNSILWLLRFPPAGERHLRRCATEWAGPQVAQRVVFTDVAPKHIHIHRGRVADLFLDTPECNAHTTAADILWSGTPIVTWPKYMHKMCSRVGASIAIATGAGDEMVVSSEQQYEDRAVELALGLTYTYDTSDTGAIARRGHGPLMSLRKRLFLSREHNRLFDTRRWTQNLERGYTEAWRRWVTAQEFEDVHQDTSTAGCIWVTDPDD